VGRATVSNDLFHGEEVAIIKPRTYMNLSGAALGPLRTLAGFDLSKDMLIAVDDYALPIGSFRIRARGSAGGHNGLRSIEEALNSKEYARLRIGVGPLPDGDIDPADFVLSSMTAEEREALAKLLPILTDAVECWVREGIEPAMNRFNRKDSQEIE
jgi:peptidyl-tRNA hydrolase, PTH1 family